MGRDVHSLRKKERVILRTPITDLLSAKGDWRRSAEPTDTLGFLFRNPSEGGSILASLVSYEIEKKFSKHSEEFGKGAVLPLSFFCLIGTCSVSAGILISM